MGEFSVLGMREILLIAVGLVAAYLVVLVLRLRRPLAPTATVKPSSPPLPKDPLEPRATDVVTVGPEISDSEFAGQLAKSSMSLEMQQLKREIIQLRSEVSRLGEEVRQLKATHNVSPIYSEAMTLAERGELPSGIAARCGISLGEAELVAALARREFGAATARDPEDPYKETGI